MVYSSRQFFYDAQIRRFLIQFIRAVSNIDVEFGGPNGTRTLQRVPVYYGDASRQAQTILRGNSENSLNAVPAMAAYIDSFTYDQPRMQEPFFVGKMHLREREFDPVSGTYTHNQGDAYTIERLMPVPYKLGVKLDIWTSNTEQKMQIIEQLAVLFNPSLEVQSTDNYIDWTSLTYVQLVSTNWTSRSVPAGADESIDIATMAFEMPIWISAPAKVKKLGVIQKIIGSIYDEQGELSEDTLLTNLCTRRKLTPLDYGIYYSGNQLKLFRASDTESEIIRVPTQESWRSVIEMYGTLVSGQSQIRLELPSGGEVIGSIAYHPTDPTVLLFEPIEDTMPVNTIQSVNAIINPINVAVDNSLLTPAIGTRYLLTDDIGAYENLEPSVWGSVVAKTNDIIEYNGYEWFVAFSSREHENTEYTSNTNTGVQYRWTGSEWVKSVEGIYKGGEWAITI